MKNRFPSIVGLLGALAVLGLNGSAAAADDLPQVRVDNVRRVFWNGEHNAFTDLIRWRDRYYLTFRSCPDGHMQHASAKVIVLASGDTKSWVSTEQVGDTIVYLCGPASAGINGSTILMNGRM